MKVDRDVCYNRFVSDFEKKEVAVAARIPERMTREIDAIAEIQDRSRGYVIRALLERGLVAFKSDGFLKPDMSRGRTLATKTRRPMIAKDLEKLQPTDRKRKTG